MKERVGKVFVNETNAMPGVPFDSTAETYRILFKDFYGRNVDDSAEKELQRCSKIMLQKTLSGYRDSDSGRFAVEK